MDYKEAVNVLFTQLPMFQRTGPASYKADLDGTHDVCELLGNPENGLKFIHVAGTNGKGTVSHMISAALQESGYKVGLFTSPHLLDFRERIRVNGEMVGEAVVIDFVEEFSASWGSPSFFELTFGMALRYFSDSEVDVVILETGMGGRLDSTNIIPTAEVCVITNIGLDHQNFLGDTIREIAVEKAGIIKDGVPVVLGKMRAEAQSILMAQALRQSCEIHYGRTFPFEVGGVKGVDNCIGITTVDGPFFKENAATAYATLEVLKSGGWVIPEEVIEGAFNNFKDISGQKGRFTFLPKSTELSSVLLDCAHNIDGMKGLMGYLGGSDKLHIVFGTVSDKNPTAVLTLIPSNSVMYWCKADVPRSMEVEILKGTGEQLGLTGEAYDSVNSALYEARRFAHGKEGVRVVVCGSVYVVGEVIESGG